MIFQKWVQSDNIFLGKQGRKQCKKEMLSRGGVQEVDDYEKNTEKDDHGRCSLYGRRSTDCWLRQ